MAKRENVNIRLLARYIIIVSSYGFIYDFLNVGISANKSIVITSIVEIMGNLKIVHRIIAISASTNITVSNLDISFVPYLNESNSIENAQINSISNT